MKPTPYKYFTGKSRTPGRLRVLAAVLIALALTLLALDNQQLRQRLRAKAGRPEGPAAHGFLRVADGRLLNQSGRPVQLRGLSSHGLIWFPQYANFRALKELRDRGANLFRAAMYADSLHEGYNENEITKRLNRSLMYAAIENALAADLYVIADWHLLLDQNPLKTVEAAQEFFGDLASRYADEPGLIYEICNEPNGETTWEDIRRYADQVIPVIRRQAPRAVILVGTPDYASDLSALPAAPLEYENVMYTYHFYFGLTGRDYRAELDRARAAGLGIFISEWGLGPGWESPEEIAAVRDFLDYCARHRISWANWSLSNADESFSALKPDRLKLSGWTADDLSLSGRLVFEALGR